MASTDKSSPLNAANGTARHISPSPMGLRHRPLGRAATFAEPSMPLNRRRSSIFSETLSDSRKSLRSSTEDLLLPRITTSTDLVEHDEPSHWHSLPLGLALLPAVGGLLFKDGSAIITDVTLLALAAIFMNWALRMPWEWYYAAQSIAVAKYSTPSVFTPIDEEDENTAEELDSVPKSDREGIIDPLDDPDKLEARKELRVHEMTSFLACFVFPGLAAWLLHAIRSQLSRPSEGLVSNYNLTIFLLVAEIRPLSHLIKMIQRRTLFLRRKINIEALQDHDRTDSAKLEEVDSRLEELEAAVANGIAANGVANTESSEIVVAKASAQASSDIRKSVQPELDALSRAMRRYEKRSTISAVQIEARLQDLEMRLKDVVVLAAAAQRNAESQPKNYIVILTNWLCAAVVIPVQFGRHVLGLPSRLLSSLLALPSRYLSGLGKTKKSREPRTTRRTLKSQIPDRDRRSRIPA